MICGIILTGIIPPFLILSEEKKDRGLFSVTIFFVIVSILIQQNANLLFGILLGSSLFQILVLNGISRITSDRRYLFTDNYQGGKYLIFGIVLLLFLSADYLLTGKTNNNMISRSDGIILIAVYLLFYLSVHRSGRGTEEKPKRGIKNGIIILSIAVGAYFLVAGIGLLAIEISQSQYFMGVLFGGIAANISSGILLSVRRNEPTKYSEQTIENVLLVNTFMIGCTVIIREIRVSQYMIYALMLFALVTIMMEGLKKIDNRLAGSGMVTVYIGIIIYIILHH